MPQKTAIVGAGTIIFKDEGIGVYAQSYIDQNYDFEDEVELVDGGVLGFQLMTYYQDYDNVLILDTITMDDAPGSIYNIPANELLGLGSYKQNAHEVEIVEMLEICSLLEKMANVHIVGIVPKDIQSVAIGITQTLQQRFETFIDTAMAQLQKMGVRFRKNSNNISLAQVISHYANPNMKAS
ncbi:MAG: HyaD/HybD family hydrogenase maturation endopeptidase [Campylobacterota bacterium]